MYFMYVDESGDTGISGSNTDYFILSGIVIHELDWYPLFKDFHNFRREINQKYKFKVRDEFHAVVMVNGNKSENNNLEKNERFMILRNTLDWIASKKEISLLTVIVKKHGCTSSKEIFELAWTNLIQRFENTLKNKNFNGQKNDVDTGIIIADNTDVDAIRKIYRKMHVINYVPSKFSGSRPRNIPIQFVIEDPVFRDSKQSYFIQLADITAYFSMQYLSPNKFVKRQGAKKYFERLEPVMIKQASPADQFGRVWIKK